MASKRHQRQKACGRKQRFTTEIAAAGAMHALIRNRPPTRRVNTYRCRFCNGYHFGHTPKALLRTAR